MLVGSGAEDGGGVEAGGVFAVAVVAPAVEDDGRYAGAGDEVEDVVVPGGEVAVAEPHLAEAVILMRISPGDPEDELRRVGVHGGGQATLQRREIVIAGDVPGQLDVQGPRRLDGRVVLTDVDRVSEDPRVVGEDGVGPVPLMGIGVQDEDPQVGLGEVLFADGDGDVIEHAVTLTLVREGMMRPAGEITGKSVLQGRRSRREGAGDLQARTCQQGLGGREPELERGDMVQLPRADLFEVFGGVDSQQLLKRRRLESMDRQPSHPRGPDHRLRPPELVHREGMFLRQREDVARIVKATHARSEAEMH